ncbi:MAG: hypothetical protein QNJ72_24370 [Pleurocapsa sp. MO_226.B13]|nr:hypothetical protein [Pleurocapsa sp. MO_226.B13]
MTIIISVLNQKWGSGKTTRSSNLAHAIANLSSVFTSVVNVGECRVVSRTKKNS